MIKDYLTCINEITVKYEEKKSIFLAHVKPVKTQQEACEYIEKIKTKFWDATHNTYAYSLILDDSIIQRYSDDGEPAGTAGLPILEVIKKKELNNLTIVVTRYFGGTMLGSGGLLRAYSKSATLGIEEAKIAKICLCYEVKLITDYNLFDKVQNFLTNKEIPQKKTDFSSNVSIIIHVNIDNMDVTKKELINLCNGAIEIEVGKKFFT